MYVLCGFSGYRRSAVVLRRHVSVHVVLIPHYLLIHHDLPDRLFICRGELVRLGGLVRLGLLGKYPSLHRIMLAIRSSSKIVLKVFM